MSPLPSGSVFFASHETPLPIQAFAKDPYKFTDPESRLKETVKGLRTGTIGGFG